MPALRFLPMLILAFGPVTAMADANDDFEALLDDAWEWQLSENPVMASRLGDRRYNGLWRDLSLDAIERRQEQRLDFQQRLRTINDAGLSAANQLNYALFRRAG